MAGCSGPREPGDHHALLAPSLVDQERDNQSRPGKGRKRASEEGSADGAQRQQKRHKAAKDTEGGSQPKYPPPPIVGY